MFHRYIHRWRFTNLSAYFTTLGLPFVDTSPSISQKVGPPPGKRDSSEEEEKPTYSPEPEESDEEIHGDADAGELPGNGGTDNII